MSLSGSDLRIRLPFLHTTWVTISLVGSFRYPVVFLKYELPSWQKNRMAKWNLFFFSEKVPPLHSEHRDVERTIALEFLKNWISIPVLQFVTVHLLSKHISRTCYREDGAFRTGGVKVFPTFRRGSQAPGCYSLCWVLHWRLAHKATDSAKPREESPWSKREYLGWDLKSD